MKGGGGARSRDIGKPDAWSMTSAPRAAGVWTWERVLVGGEAGGAPRLGERPSSFGDLPIAGPPVGSAPGGVGARGRGGESESLGENATRLATRAQSEAGPAMEHDALRWP